MNDAASANTIAVDHDLTASPATVWRALTEPALIASWLMENDFQPIVGHRFTFRSQPSPHWDGIVQCEVLVERSHRHEFFYVAGVEVSSIDNVPEGMLAYVIPAATFAAITHTGSLDRLDETIGGMYEQWLPSSGRIRRSNVPDVELYDERFNPGSEESQMVIQVPIE